MALVWSALRSLPPRCHNSPFVLGFTSYKPAGPSSRLMGHVGEYPMRCSTKGHLSHQQAQKPSFRLRPVTSLRFGSIRLSFRITLYRFIMIHEAPLPQRRITKTKNTTAAFVIVFPQTSLRFRHVSCCIWCFLRKIKSASSTAFGYTGCSFYYFFILAEKGLLSRQGGSSDRVVGKGTGGLGSILGGRARL